MLHVVFPLLGEIDFIWIQLRLETNTLNRIPAETGIYIWFQALFPFHK